MNEGFFTSAGTVNPPLTALQDGVDGGNGVYRYGSGGGFPTSSYNGSNYWVDVVFSPSGPDVVKPTVTDRQPAPGTTGVPVTTAPAATFSEAVDPATIVMSLTAGATTVPSSTSYSSGHPDRHAHPERQPGHLDHLHGERVRRA